MMKLFVLFVAESCIGTRANPLWVGCCDCFSPAEDAACLPQRLEFRAIGAVSLLAMW
jgi:hypothetical protein